MNAQEIKEIRNKLHLTQVQFAVKIGVTPSTVYLWESGKAKPSSLALQKLLKLKIKEVIE